MQEYNSLRDKHLTGYFAESPNAVDCCADVGLVRAISSSADPTTTKRSVHSASSPRTPKPPLSARTPNSKAAAAAGNSPSTPAQPPRASSSPRKPVGAPSLFLHGGSGGSPPCDRYEQVLIPFDTERQMRFLNRAVAAALDEGYRPKNHGLHMLRTAAQRSSVGASGGGGGSGGTAIGSNNHLHSSRGGSGSGSTHAGGGGGGMNRAFLARIDQDIGKRVSALSRAKDVKQMEAEEKQRRALEVYKTERRRRLILEQKWKASSAS